MEMSAVVLGSISNCQLTTASVVDKAAMLDSKLEASSYSNFPTLKRPFARAAPPGYCCCGVVSPLSFWGIKFVRGQSFRVKKNL